MPGSGSRRPCFDAMHQLARLACGGNEVVPAACDVQLSAQPEDAVGDGVAVVVIVEEPAVELGVAQSGLNGFEVHVVQS